MWRLFVYCVLSCLCWSAIADFADGTLAQIWTCDPKAEGQKWVIPNDESYNIRLVADGKCLDVEAWNPDDGATVWLYACHPNLRPENQQWLYNQDKNGNIYSKFSGKCLDIKGGDTSDGTPVQLWDCTKKPNQQWFYNATDGTIRTLSAKNMCLDVGTETSCANFPQYPYCNWTLPVDERVQDLLSRLTISEKIAQLVHQAPAVSRLGVSSYNYWTECLHGVLATGTTSFPQVIGLGASFNMSLVHSITNVIATEARALFNTKKYPSIGGGVGGLDCWSPNINVFRDPRWGRGQETPGEDPYLNSRYAHAFITGLQVGEDPRYHKAISTCKHYDAYDLENWNGTDRHHFDAKVNDRDLVETYMPAFKSCVDASAGSIMCSYNSVNGIPSCANDFLMNEVMRGEWGFDGYIVSDCGAISDIQYTHHYTNDVSSTCRAAIKAGCDLNCGSYYAKCEVAVNDKNLTEADIDQALGRMFTARMKLGMFDPPSIQPYARILGDKINTPAAQQLALEAARQSIVLLQNTNSVLPLSATTVKTVAAIGPNANNSEVLLGNYHGTPAFVITPTDALLKRGLKVLYAKGCDINSPIKSGFQAAVQAAQAADAVLLFFGLDQSIESEGHDRTVLSLPGVQLELIQTIVQQVPNKPIVLVLINGGIVAESWLGANIKAIVEAFYPGEHGGTGIVDVLFGDYNPSGRLPVTVLPAEYVNQISFFDMNMADQPGQTYRYYSGTPLWPFGFGLSYTQFKFQILSQETDQVVSTLMAEVMDTVAFRVRVTNIGNRSGAVSVLAFVNYTENTFTQKTEVPKQKELFNFEKIFLNPGQYQDVFFSSDARSRSLVTTINGKTKRIVPAGSFKIFVEDQTLTLKTFNRNRAPYTEISLF